MPMSDPNRVLLQFGEWTVVLPSVFAVAPATGAAIVDNGRPMVQIIDLLTGPVQTDVRTLIETMEQKPAEIIQELPDEASDIEKWFENLSKNKNPPPKQ